MQPVKLPEGVLAMLRVMLTATLVVLGLGTARAQDAPRNGGG